MTAKREYLDYPQDIFVSLGEIEVFVAGMDFERFASDKRTVNAVIRSLEVIGEAAKKIPMDISDAHPGVPWSKMCGMRDKLIHEVRSGEVRYGEIMFGTAGDNLPRCLL